MQPMNLKAIARDAALRGDTKTLFHTLDRLEQLMPIATFMDFCTELDELRTPSRTIGFCVENPTRQHEKAPPKRG